MKISELLTIIQESLSTASQRRFFHASLFSYDRSRPRDLYKYGVDHFGEADSDKLIECFGSSWWERVDGCVFLLPDGFDDRYSEYVRTEIEHPSFRKAVLYKTSNEKEVVRWDDLDMYQDELEFLDWVKCHKDEADWVKYQEAVRKGEALLRGKTHCKLEARIRKAIAELDEYCSTPAFMEKYWEQVTQELVSEACSRAPS